MKKRTLSLLMVLFAVMFSLSAVRLTAFATDDIGGSGGYVQPGEPGDGGDVIDWGDDDTPYNNDGDTYTPSSANAGDPAGGTAGGVSSVPGVTPTAQTNSMPVTSQDWSVLASSAANSAAAGGTVASQGDTTTGGGVSILLILGIVLIVLGVIGIVLFILLQRKAGRRNQTPPPPPRSRGGNGSNGGNGGNGGGSPKRPRRDPYETEYGTDEDGYSYSPYDMPGGREQTAPIRTIPIQRPQAPQSQAPQSQAYYTDIQSSSDGRQHREGYDDYNARHVASDPSYRETGHMDAAERASLPKKPENNNDFDWENFLNNNR